MLNTLILLWLMEEGRDILLVKIGHFFPFYYLCSHPRDGMSFHCVLYRRPHTRNRFHLPMWSHSNKRSRTDRLAGNTKVLGNEDSASFVAAPVMMNGTDNNHNNYDNDNMKERKNTYDFIFKLKR